MAVGDFETFFADHYGSVLRAIALAVGDRSRAEDAVQEAFAQALRKWRSVSGMERPVAWVYVVALNASRKDWRRESRRSSGDIDNAVIPDHGGSIVEALDLREALSRLSARQRAAVVLRYLADLSTRDTAAALGCAEGTVKATLHQALVLLRVSLDGSSPSEGDQ